MKTLTGFGLPANIDTFGQLMVVPELFARVSLLDAQNNVVAQLGDDSDRIRSDTKHDDPPRPAAMEARQVRASARRLL